METAPLVGGAGAHLGTQRAVFGIGGWELTGQKASLERHQQASEGSRAGEDRVLGTMAALTPTPGTTLWPQAQHGELGQNVEARTAAPQGRVPGAREGQGAGHSPLPLHRAQGTWLGHPKNHRPSPAPQAAHSPLGPSRLHSPVFRPTGSLSRYCPPPQVLRMTPQVLTSILAPRYRALALPSASGKGRSQGLSPMTGAIGRGWGPGLSGDQLSRARMHQPQGSQEMVLGFPLGRELLQGPRELTAAGEFQKHHTQGVCYHRGLLPLFSHSFPASGSPHSVLPRRGIFSIQPIRFPSCPVGLSPLDQSKIMMIK